MAKEKFLVIAHRIPDDCFGRFSETANREAIDAGTVDTSDPYSWIEASFEIVLVRYREATHLCSFTPSARQYWLQNYFVGIPNEAWDYDGDPEGLELESGGETTSYGTYYDEYPADIICDTFTIDTVKDLGIRKPTIRSTTLSRRSDREAEALERYTDAVWQQAMEVAQEIQSNGGFECERFDPYRFRQHQRKINPVIQHLTA